MFVSKAIINFFPVLELIIGKPRSSRVNGVPDRGPNKKFNCGAIWLNNNHLPNLNDLKKIINELFEHPIYLTWIDVSFNELKKIDRVRHFINAQNYLVSDCFSF